jgi:hypothetical protein
MSKKNRSKKQNSKSNVHMEQSSLGNRTTSPMPTTLQDRMALIDNKLDDIAGEMDRDYMAYGKTCAKLFRATCLPPGCPVLPGRTPLSCSLAKTRRGSPSLRLYGTSVWPCHHLRFIAARHW